MIGSGPDRVPSSADRKQARRELHNAAERQRRVDLTKALLELSSLLFPVPPDRPPTRIDIINSAIAHIRATQDQTELAAQEMRIMDNELAILRSEVNDWRTSAGVVPLKEPARRQNGGEEGLHLQWLDGDWPNVQL
ncbi:hypothetical protein R3P38DRAFT_3229070 [Favolaschia claudopus]|uniref:BHLH domain-containing protein n=1 Tax=Favolaschia claudopus TaxID=2862362 RepID=A0AAV9ZNT5_9AGAR